MKFLVKSIFVLFAFSTFVHAEVRKERQVALIGVEPRAGGVSVVGTFLVEGVKAAASVNTIKINFSFYKIRFYKFHNLFLFS
jgi:hypothetical protein